MKMPTSKIGSTNTPSIWAALCINGTKTQMTAILKNRYNAQERKKGLGNKLPE